MQLEEKRIKEITKMVGKNFRTFGGGDIKLDNPIAAALADRPLMFAAGTDVEDVVRLVVTLIVPPVP